MLIRAYSNKYHTLTSHHATQGKSRDSGFVTTGPCSLPVARGTTSKHQLQQERPRARLTILPTHVLFLSRSRPRPSIA